MMKMLKTLFSLLLCLALMLPCAVAEEAYVPGAISRELTAQAWNSGKMLNADVQLRLDLEGQALGFTEEDQQIMDAISAVLDAATVNLAIGKLDKGIRLEAGAALKNAQGGSDVTADAAANLDLYGVSLESSLLPGQKVTAKWETLLAMAGMSDSDIAMLMSLRDIDWATVLPQVLSMIESYMGIAMQLATPYAETVMAWTSTLTVEELSNVAASDALPAAAKVTNIYLCEKDVGNLLTALADTLEADTTMTAMADMLLAQAASEMGETAPTTAQLIAEMRAAAEGMTDTESPIMLTLGTDETGAPLYGELYIMDATGAGVYGCLIGVPSEAGMTCIASLMNITAEGTVSDGFSMEMALSAAAMSTFMQAFAGGAPVFGIEHSLTFAEVTTSEGQPGMTADQSMTMNVADGSEEVQMVMATNALYARTSDGGETADVTVAMDMYVEGMAVSINAVGGMSLFPTADGGFTGSYGLTESMPAMGINNIGFDAMLSTAAYDPASTAALAETAFETSSSETMDALMVSLGGTVQGKMAEVLGALPTNVQALLLAQ